MREKISSYLKQNIVNLDSHPLAFADTEYEAVFDICATCTIYWIGSIAGSWSIQIWFTLVSPFVPLTSTVTTRTESAPSLTRRRRNFKRSRRGSDRFSRSKLLILGKELLSIAITVANNNNLFINSNKIVDSLCRFFFILLCIIHRIKIEI